MKQQNIYEMSDRELKNYKRRLKQRIIFRRKCMLVLMTICMIMMGTVCYHSINSNATGHNDPVAFKYYTNITVASGETLWEISDRYIDYTRYKNKEAYITELQHINHLDADGSIKAGQKLIVPYYSNEFIK